MRKHFMNSVAVLTLILSMNMVGRVLGAAGAKCIPTEDTCSCSNQKEVVALTCDDPSARLDLSEIVSKMRQMNLNFTSVKIEMSNIPTIQNVSFAGLRIEILSLKYNRIQRISPQVFDGFSQCKTIYLRFNFLKEPVWLGSSQLESLNLGWNLFTRLDRAMFVNITNLRSLDLAHNKISRINWDTFVDLKMLRTLSIFNNQIKYIADDGFRYLSVLTELNIGMNYMDEIRQEQLTGLSNVSNFLINYNYLSSVNNESMKSLNSLKSLNLSFQMIKTLSRSELKGLSKIEALNMSCNLIESIENGTFQDMASSLRVLDFSSNLIVNVCPFVQNLSYLSITFLNLSYNEFQDLGSFCFQSQSKLKELYLDTNELTALRVNVFKGLENSLQYLSIRMNNIQFIKKYYFPGMIALRELNMSYNQISSIEIGSFDSLTNLTTLGLDTNCIYSVDSNTWRGLVNLNYLRLDRNVLRQFNFANTTKIKYLDLSDNLLESLSLDQFNSLETLDISNNPYLRKLESSRSLNLCKTLRMSKTDLTTIRLPALPLLQTLDVSYTNSYTVFTVSNLIPSKASQMIELDVSYCRAFDLAAFSNKNLSLYVQAKVKQFKLRSANLTDINDLRRYNGMLSLDISEIKWSNITFTQSTVFVKGVYPRIQILYAEDIGFSSIDALNLQVPTNLIELYLGWNQFEYVSSSHFKSNPKLQVLCLNDNGLKYIENGTLLSLINLVYLDVSNNFLKYLEPFYNLMVYLNARNNSLTEMFNTELHEVNSLDFSDNFLTEFPSIRSFSVDYLNLSVNDISNLKNDSFLFFYALTRLDLNRNQIESIEPNTFKKLHFLLELDLSGNNISILNELTFSGLTNLKYLNMSNNKIESIHHDLFNNLVALIDLDMSFNQLKLIEDSSLTGLYSLRYLSLVENSNLRQISKLTFAGLQDTIVLIEVDHSLVERVQNFKILYDTIGEKQSHRRITVDSQLNVLFYHSKDIVFYTEQVYTQCECKQILRFVKHNRKLNLYSDSLIDKFLSECQEYFDSLIVKTGLDVVALVIDNPYCFSV